MSKEDPSEFDTKPLHGTSPKPVPEEKKSFTMGKLCADMDHVKSQTIILHRRVDNVDKKIDKNHTEICDKIDALMTHRIKVSTVWKAACWTGGTIVTISGLVVTILMIVQHFKHH